MCVPFTKDLRHKLSLDEFSIIIEIYIKQEQIGTNTLENGLKFNQF